MRNINVFQEALGIHETNITKTTGLTTIPIFVLVGTMAFASVLFSAVLYVEHADQENCPQQDVVENG